MSKCDFCGQPIAGTGRRYCGVVCQIMARCSGTHSPDACWVWEGALRENGYGLVRVMIGDTWRTRSPFRVMYAAHHGEVPETKSVLNTCKTKNCCNPKHLTLGVQERQLLRGDVEKAA